MAGSKKNRAILAEIKAKTLKDSEFKNKLMSDPMSVLKAAGAEVEAGLNIKIVENTADTRYVVLPYAGDCQLSAEDLDKVAAGGSTATYTNTVQTTEVATTEVQEVETTTTEAAEAETTVVAVGEVVAT